MTINEYTAVCKGDKYTLASTEYSGECYCDNAFRIVADLPRTAALDGKRLRTLNLLIN
jgi:hypothetical protein